MRFISGTLLIPFLIALLAPSMVLGETATLEKFDTLRLENEITFDVPVERAEEVWSWLNQRFQSGFQSHGYNLATFPDIEEFADTYFDSPELTLIKREIGLRHRRRFFPNGEIKELIQIKKPNSPVVITGADTLNDGSEKQTRGELKFELKAPTITYRHGADLLNEELFRIVRREHVQALRERLLELGVNPERVRPILALEQQRRRIYFRENGAQFLTVTLDFAKSQKLWVKARFVQLDIEIGEIAFTVADPDKRKRLLGVQSEIFREITTQFPEMKRNQTPKVLQMLNVIRSQGIFSYLTVRFGISLVLLAAFLGLVVVVWIGGLGSRGESSSSLLPHRQ